MLTLMEASRFLSLVSTASGGRFAMRGEMYSYQGYGLHAAAWHDNFGRRMSHGCVNLPVPEAKWLFDCADVGTLVNVYE